MGIDLLSLSGHKIYAPKGIGALYISETLLAEVTPLIVGGGQERGVRSGTHAVPLIVGLGKACEIARLNMDNNLNKARGLMSKFLTELDDRNIKYSIVGPNSMLERLPGCLSLSFENLNVRERCEYLPNLGVSASSACSSKSGSHVLDALGFSSSDANKVLRISFGRFSGLDDPSCIADALMNLIIEETQ